MKPYTKQEIEVVNKELQYNMNTIKNIHENIIEFLKFSLKCKDGMTAIQFIISYMKNELNNKISYRIDENVFISMTPLHLAVILNNKELFLNVYKETPELLFQLSSNNSGYSPKDCFLFDRQTPYSLAIALNNNEFIEFIEQNTDYLNLRSKNLLNKDIFVSLVTDNKEIFTKYLNNYSIDINNWGGKNEKCLAYYIPTPDYLEKLLNNGFVFKQKHKLECLKVWIKRFNPYRPNTKNILEILNILAKYGYTIEDFSESYDGEMFLWEWLSFNNFLFNEIKDFLNLEYETHNGYNFASYLLDKYRKRVPTHSVNRTTLLQILSQYGIKVYKNNKTQLLSDIKYHLDKQTKNPSKILNDFKMELNKIYLQHNLDENHKTKRIAI